MIQIYQKYNELNVNKLNVNKKDKLNKKKKKPKNKKKENKKSFLKSFLKWTGIIIGIMILLAFFMPNPHHSNNLKKSSSLSSQQIQTKHQNKKNLKINNIPVNIESIKIKNSVKNVIKNSVKNVDMNPLLNKTQKQVKQANGNKNNNQIKIPDSNQTKQVKQKIKYKTVLFCKNITPLNNQVIYFVKIAGKMVPVYTLNNWDGKGIKFKAYELKQMLSKIIIDNKTYYEVQKGKYLINTKNSIKCFAKKVEVENGNN